MERRQLLRAATAAALLPAGAPTMIGPADDDLAGLRRELHTLVRQRFDQGVAGSQDALEAYARGLATLWTRHPDPAYASLAAEAGRRAARGALYRGEAATVHAWSQRAEAFVGEAGEPATRSLPR